MRRLAKRAAKPVIRVFLRLLPSRALWRRVEFGYEMRPWFKRVLMRLQAP